MSSPLTRLKPWLYRNRSIAFTPPGTRFVLLTLVVGVAAVNTGNNLLYLIVGMMLSLIIVSGILSEQSLRRIRLQWDLPHRVFAQKPVPAWIKIRNEKRYLPSFSFHVEETALADLSRYVFKLSAGQTLEASCQIGFPKRGLHAIPPAVLRTTFPFGFFRKSLIHPPVQKVLVYPRVIPLRREVGRGRLPIEASQPNRDRGSGSELHSLRDYTSADDARGIHWKASARESKLLTKEFEREEDQRVSICLSDHLPGYPERPSDGPPRPRPGSMAPTAVPDRLREDFERAVQLTASLVVSLDRKGYAVDLLFLSSVESAPDPSNSVDEHLRRLALLEPIAEVSLPALTDRMQAVIHRPSKSPNRLLILPVPDPTWEPMSHRFTEVWIASEPEFKQWAGHPGGLA